MKYPCNVIQDLLPLYHDRVCSKESTEIIENHLLECAACKEYYMGLCEADTIMVAPPDTDHEMKKAASFQAVKKKLLRKQVLIVAIVFAILAIIFFSVVGALKNSDKVITYDDNISVSMTDGSLIGRLKSSMANDLTVHRIEMNTDGQAKTYLFFCMSDTTWSDITTSDDVFSEYVLCPADKGAEQVDSVYYYTGDYAGIESMNEEELQKVINTSVLLWRK